MKLDELMRMMENDSKIDRSNLEGESLNVPLLYSKWYKLFVGETLKLKALQERYQKLHKEKYEYYSGKASDEVYMEKPLDKRILKSDISKYIESDEEILSLVRKIETQKLKVRMIEDHMKMIAQRPFLIKSIIDFLKFQNGIV